MQNVLIAAIVIEAIVILALLFIIIKSNKSNKKIMKNAGQIVKGKLDVDDIDVSGKENNSVVLAKSFNSIKNNLLVFIESTKSNVVILSDFIDTLSSSVNAMKDGNMHVAEGITDVAGKAAEQLELVKQNLALIEENGCALNDAEESMDNIRDMLKETIGISKTGMNNLVAYERDMDKVTEDLKSVDVILSKFNDGIKQIEEVSDFITGISSQLRLLAFNASIEAARAGQAGKGFSVVADEMSEMSLKTKEGIDTINSIVEDIIEGSRQVNESVKNCESAFTQSKSAFTQVNKSFRAINKKASSINESMKEISNKFVVISDNSDATIEKVNDIFDASKAISSNTEDIASTSEESAAEAFQIGENVNSLKDMLSSIQNLLKQFDTAVVPVAKRSTNRLRIRFYSMLDNDFWYGIRRGVFYAQRELAAKNTDVEFRPFLPGISDLDDAVRAEIQGCIDDKVDGIVIPGFLGAANEYLKRAISEGIKVITYNCDCSREVHRLACFQPDNYEAGVSAAKSMDKLLGGEGNIVVMTGPDKVGGFVERKNGFVDAISKIKGIKIVSEILTTDSFDEDGNSIGYYDDTYAKTVELLKSRNDINAIFITTGAPIAVAKAIEDTGNTNSVRVIVFDHSPEIFSYIKKDIIAAAIGQDAFGQGHDPVVWMHNHIVTGDPLPGEFITCRSSVVDKTNVDSLIQA